MARRLSAEEKRRLAEEDFWARYNREREELAASGANQRTVSELEQNIFDTAQRPSFSNVSTNNPNVQDDSIRTRRAIDSVLLPRLGVSSDNILDAASSAVDIGAGALDMFAPDPNALAADSTNPFQNAVENVIDTTLRINPIVDDTLRGLASRIAPDAAPEAIDAVMTAVNPFGGTFRDAVAEREQRRGNTIERTGVANQAADVLRDTAEVLRSQRSPESIAAGEALGKAVDGGVLDTAQFLASPQGLRAGASVAFGSAPYAGLGFGVGTAGRLAGLSSRAGATAAGTTTFATIASNNAAEAENAILSLGDEEAAVLPGIQELMANGMSLEQARQRTAATARFNTVAAMAPVAPLYASGLFERMGAGAHTANILSTLRGRVASGVAREVGTETVQEASERYATNVAQVGSGQRAEADRFQGVAASGVLGGLAAGPIAGGASYVEATTDFSNRGDALLRVAEQLEQRALARAAQQEEVAQSQFEEERMGQLAANDAQREFISQPGVPAADNAGRPVEPFEAYAAREGAEGQAMIDEENAAAEAQAAFLGQNTLESSNAALRNSLREGPRGATGAELTDTRAQRAAENQRLAAGAASDQEAFTQEQLDQAAFEEEAMGRLAARDTALEEARTLDTDMTAAEAKAEAGRLQKARSAHAANRRSHLASVRNANKDVDADTRATAIAEAALAWDAANPVPTQAATVAAPAAPAARPARTPRVRGTSAVGAPPAVSEADLAELGLTEDDMASTTSPDTTLEREAALRAQFGRADDTSGTTAPRAAADVIRELAGRVRSGNDSEALAQEQLINKDKLRIVDADQMATIAPEAPNARGYYDGERMYINANRVPEGNATGAVLQEILAHEADHAARLGGDTAVKSRVRIMLGDGQTEKLLDQLRTSTHRDAVAARNMVESVGVNEETDPQRYEDELTAYAITSAVRNQNAGTWAPIRGLVSAARRKMKEFTGSDTVNLDDLAGYAQETINALATTDGDITSETEGRADASGPYAADVNRILDTNPENGMAELMNVLAEDRSLPSFERKLAERLAPLMEQFNIPLIPDTAAPLMARDPTVAGVYQGSSNTIAIRAADSITILHEALHGVTRNLLAQRRVGKDNMRLQELRTEFDDMLEALREHNRSGGFDKFPQNVRNMLNADGGPLSSVQELLSYGMTEPEMMAVLSTLEAPKRSRFPNMWAWFKNAIAKFYGTSEDDVSFLEQLIENTGALVEFANSNPGVVRAANEDAANVARNAAGRADNSADAPALPSHAFAPNKFSETVRDATKNAATWHGAEGKKAALLIEQSEGLLNSFYSHALSFSNRTTRGIELAASKLAKKEGISKKEALTQTEAMLERRLSTIRKLPSQSARDKALTNLVNEHPDLAPVQEAIEAINSFTKKLISERMADPTPLTEQEVETYEFMARNQSGYLTNTYALFQGGAGREYAGRLASLAQKGYDALAANKAIPKDAREEFRVYDNALKFVIANDVAVNDPEMLAAMSMEDVTNLHDMWAPAGQKASDIRTIMQNDGTFAQETFKDVMSDRIIEWVEAASPEEIDAHGKIVVNTLLRLNDMSGPAKRYAKASGVDTSILKHLQGVPEPIAQLYGRIEDVPTLLLTTVTEMGELAARSELFNNIRNQGYGSMVVSLRDRAQDPAKYEEFRIPLSGDSFGPLQGLYTTEAMARALTDYNEGFTTLLENVVDLGTIGKSAGVFMNAVDAVGKPLAKLNSLYKAMAIPTRIDYLLLNAVGSISTPILVGGVHPRHMVTGFKVAAKAVANTLDPQGTWHDSKIDFDSNLAAAMGVMENVVLQDIRQQPRKLVQRFIEDIGQADDAAGIAAAFKKAKEYGGRGWQAWLEAFSMSDAWVRYPVALQRMDYLRDYYTANGESVTNQRLMNEAADYAKNVTMTAARAPGLVRGAERRGLTMYGNYLFNVPRVIAMNGKAIFDSFNMAKEAKTPEAFNIAMVDGIKKTMGYTAMLTLLATGIKAAADALMDDDEKEQLERDRAFLAAPTGELAENQYADLVYVGLDDEGNRMYINLSRADAHGPTTDIFRAWRSGENPAESALMAGEAAVGILIQSAVLGQLSKIAFAAFTDEDVQARTSRLDKMAPDLSSRARNAIADLVPGDSGYKWAELLTEAAGMFIPAGVANRFENINPSVAQVENASLAETVAVLEALGHKFVVVRPELATKGAAFDLKEARSEANRQIRATLTASGPEAALDTFARVAQEERRAVERVGTMYHSMLDSGVSRRQAQALLREVKLDARSISNIHNRNYEAEADDWIRRHSTLFSKNTMSAPPGKLTEEEKKEWKRQAKEVKKRVKIMGYDSEENE